MTVFRRHTKTVALVVLTASLAVTAVAQRRGGFGIRLPSNPPYDGAFQYCRGMYQAHPQGDGGGWTNDYPQADENLPFRFSELTKVSVSRDARQDQPRYVGSQRLAGRVVLHVAGPRQIRREVDSQAVADQRLREPAARQSSDIPLETPSHHVSCV